MLPTHRSAAMANMPVKFKRVAAALDEVARVRLCESSGSEHSPSESFTDLSDLVMSFMEREGRAVKGEEEELEEGNDGDRGGDEERLDDEMFENGDYYLCDDSETKEKLKELLGHSRNGFSDLNDDDVKRKIGVEVELACKFIQKDNTGSSQDFKRQLMARLRDRGFDAGLCKSKWEKSGRVTAGEYQYIDVNSNDTRYIVEVFLAGEFKVARPTSRFNSLLELFPPIFVGRPEELKQVVRLICMAIRQSLKSRELLVPPWRKNGYMQAKWFGSYKRTTNKLSTTLNMDDEQKPGNCHIGMVKSVGFDNSKAAAYACRGDFQRKTRLRIGHLTAALSSDDLSAGII